MIYRVAFIVALALLWTACAETHHTKTNSTAKSPATLAPPGFRPTVGIPARFAPFGGGAHVAP